jgi:hypothetical protein
MMDHVAHPAKEEDERPASKPSPSVSESGQSVGGSYYYDDSSNYEVYQNDDDDDADDSVSERSNERRG